MKIVLIITTMIKNNTHKKFLLSVKNFYLEMALTAYRVSQWAENKDFFLKEAEFMVKSSEEIDQELKTI